MSEEREPHPKRSTAWMEKFKERSTLYSDRPNKYVRPTRLGAIHKRLGKKIDSTDDQADEKSGILMQTSNGPSQHDNNVGGSGGRNPFRSAAGNAYRSVATVTSPDSMASQSLDEKDPLQMIKVKIERHSPVKASTHQNGYGNGVGDGDRGRSTESTAGYTSAKRTREDESESIESDDVTVVQMPVKRQKIDDTSIDLGLYFALP